jgi:hypothetical protein
MTFIDFIKYNIIVQVTEETACFFLYFPRFSTTHRGRVCSIPSVAYRAFRSETHHIMVLSMTWLECKDMAQESLVSREPVSAS